jgi:hypothetical protein
MAKRLVVEVGWRRCCLKDCWECLLFTGARSMERAVQWSPTRPESWSGCFTLKSSPTCSNRCLCCDLQNVPREHPNCTARTQRANSSESSSWLTEAKSKLLYDWRSASQYVSVSGTPWLKRLPLHLCLCLEADPSVDTAHNNSCIVAIVGYHGNSIYRAVVWIPIWVTCGRFPWKAPTSALHIAWVAHCQRKCRCSGGQ